MINLREWALPVYTIMIQMAAGSLLILWLVYTRVGRRYDWITADRISHNPLIVILITIAAAMVGSHYHLSRPIFSIFALNNFGTSWLSREIAFTIVFGILVGMLWFLQHYKIGTFKLRLAIGWSAVAMGLITVYCMAHVYLLPTQIAWNAITTPIAFFGAAFLLGSIAVSVLLLMNFYLVMLQAETGTELEKYTLITQQVLFWATIIATVATIIELLNYVYQIQILSNGTTSARVSLDLLLDLYRVLFGIRLGILGFGIIALSGVTLWQQKTNQPLVRLLIPIYVIFLLALVSEILGRFLFYAIHVRTGI